MCVNLDAAADRDHWRLSGRRGDGYGAHLVVQAIVVAIINNKVEDVSDWLASCLKGSDVPMVAGNKKWDHWLNLFSHEIYASIM